MTYHQPLLIGGIAYDFSHLDPFDMPVVSERAAKTLSVHVTFTNHCFTVAHDVATHPIGMPILQDGGGRQRAFDTQRYDLSQQMLPGVIHTLNHPRAVVKQTVQLRNWVYSTVIPTPTGSYDLFFEIRRGRAGHDLDLIVESAYPSPTGPRVMGSINFILLCGKAYRGEKILTKR